MNIKITEEQLNRRVMDLTVRELLELLGRVPAVDVNAMPTKEKEYVYGIAGIARMIHTSLGTAGRLKASGIIDAAVTQWGRTIVVDKELALELIRKSNSNLKENNTGK
jgi:hypothetical protein